MTKKSTTKKDERLNLRINHSLKVAVRAYCEKHGIDTSELVTRFFTRVLANEAERSRKAST